MPQHLTVSNPQTALVDLSLNAVALCAAGANSRADIILHKRKETKSMPKTFDQLMDELTPEARDVVKSHIDGLRAEDATTIGNLQGRITDLEKKAPAPAADTSTDADILKNASPEVRAYLEKQNQLMQQLLDAQAETMVEKRYALCKAIPVEEATLKDVLKSASPAVFDILAKASAAIEAGLAKGVGSDADGARHTGGPDEAYAALEKAAKSISAEQGVTFEKAFTIACAQQPETYKKYVEGVS